MQGKWDYHRHEDATAGVPDISYCYEGSCGWIELKVIKNWPKRPTTKVQTGLTPIQKVWMKRRHKHGGRIFVFIQIPEGYLVYKDIAIFHLNDMTREEMFAYCSWELSSLEGLYIILSKEVS